MQDLTVYRAKPNPLGKDKLGQLSSNSQLNGEWFDIFNSSGKSLNMRGVKIYDHTFSPYTCRDEGRRLVFTFDAWLFPSGKIVRIHSGREVPENQLSYIDKAGADYHAFTENGYVLNNVCGDKIEIYNEEIKFIDSASYSRNATEGSILRRQGSVLV